MICRRCGNGLQWRTGEVDGVISEEEEEAELHRMQVLKKDDVERERREKQRGEINEKGILFSETRDRKRK